MRAVSAHGTRCRGCPAVLRGLPASCGRGDVTRQLMMRVHEPACHDTGLPDTGSPVRFFHHPPGGLFQIDPQKTVAPSKVRMHGEPRAREHAPGKLAHCPAVGFLDLQKHAPARIQSRSRLRQQPSR